MAEAVNRQGMPGKTLLPEIPFDQKYENGGAAERSWTRGSVGHRPRGRAGTDTTMATLTGCSSGKNKRDELAKLREKSGETPVKEDDPEAQREISEGMESR